MFFAALKSIFGGGSKNKPTTSNFSSTNDAVGSSGNVSLDAIASAPKNSIMDDIQMDLGIKPKNAAYYRDLPDRQRRSQAAMERMMASNDNDDSSPAPQSTSTSTTSTSTSTAPQPPQPPSGGSTPGDAEQEVIDQVNDQQNASSGSSQAGGTIATTAAGLLSDDAALRRRRRLQGTGLIS